MIALLIGAAAQAAIGPTEGAAVSSLSQPCADESRAEIVVCAPPRNRYRIDPAVLDAQRVLEAPPPKPAVTADSAPASGCVGPDTCKSGTVPLVGMALVAAKAAALAAEGEDWRDALRIHEDEYRLYKQAEARRAKERKVRVGLGVK
jgi:hypothetical protein